MKFVKILSGLLTFTAIVSDSEAKEPPTDLPFYLLIGQSNMAGRAPIGPDETGILAGCYLLNAEGEWVPAKNPLNRYSTIRKGLEMQKLGPGWQFAKTMLSKAGSSPIGLVVNAKGGSNIDEWERGDRFYDDAIKRVKAAQKSGVLKGVLWHQGEANARDGEYLHKLKTLIGSLRKDLDVPDLPFVAGQVFGDVPVNTFIARLPEEVPATACVSSEGLAVMDGVHFDHASVNLLGQRYAEKMRELLEH